MRRSLCLLLAAASLCGAAHAATRPHYGGTLHVEMREALSSPVPEIAADSPNAGASERVASLIYDRLVSIDDRGVVQPQLATGWEHSAEFKRWVFQLRPGVKLHDGTALSARLMVASLAASNPDWHLRIEGEDLLIDTSTPQPGMLAELAMARNSIVAHASDGAPIGSGPFRISEWQAGRHAVLMANEDYWGGRPFLNSIVIEMGRGLHDQQVDVMLGKADVVEIAPDQVRRASQDGRRVVTSSPVDTYALQFMPGRAAVEDPRIVQAVALSVDRAAIPNILLQKQGEPGSGLLPQWVSGYEFLLAGAADPVHARELRDETGTRPNVALVYDAADGLAHAIADRVAVNAREAGIVLQTFAENSAARAGTADIRLLRLHTGSPDARAALTAIAATLNPAEVSQVEELNGSEELYKDERSLLQTYRIVPLVHVPESYMVAPRVRNWTTPREGGWRLEQVWLEAP